MARHRGLVVLGAAEPRRRTLKHAYAVATRLDFVTVTPIVDTGEASLACFLMAPLPGASLGRPGLDRYAAWLEASGIAFVDFLLDAHDLTRAPSVHAPLD